MSRNRGSMDEPNSEDYEQGIVQHFLSLPADERRQRLLTLPDYPEVRDEIIVPDRITTQTWYFWKRWAPKLGPIATALYIRLRMHCYYNRETGELRDTCYPKQSTLAEEIGLRDKKAIMRAIRVLEDHGLVRREPQYRYDAVQHKKVRTTDLYRVMMADPIAPEDEPDLVVRMATRITKNRARMLEDEPQRPKSLLGTQVKDAVDNFGPKSLKGTEVSGPSKGLEVLLLGNTPNVDNVGGIPDRILQTRTMTGSRARQQDASKTDQDPARWLRNHPAVQRLTESQKADRERLAAEIGERLKNMAGDRGLQDHKSAGFHRRVAFLMPGNLVEEALRATRDAVDDENSGRKAIRRGPAAYFAGIVRQIVDREGIDLGVQWKAEAPAATS